MKELCLKYRIAVCPKTESTKQMVLDTDNQEKEAPHEVSPPMTPELPGAPSSFPNMTPYLGAASPQKPNRVWPLVETGGEYRPTQCISPSPLRTKTD